MSVLQPRVLPNVLVDIRGRHGCDPHYRSPTFYYFGTSDPLGNQDPLSASSRNVELAGLRPRRRNGSTGVCFFICWVEGVGFRV